MSLPPELFPEAISPKQVVFVAMTIGWFAVAIPMTLRFAWMDRFCLAGILFMAINPVDVTFFSYTHYRGDIRGIEFGVTDWLTITLIIAMRFAPRWRKRKLYYRSPNDIVMWSYFGWCVLSIAVATIPQFAFFGVTRLIRGYAMFWVALNFIRDEDDLRFFVWSVVGITLYSFSQVMLDKYVRHIYQTRGSFDHQNTLATFQNVMNFIVFAMLMGDTKKIFDWRSKIYWIALATGSYTTIATLSRGGLVTMIAGYAIITPLLLLLKQEGQKLKKKFSAIGVMFLAALPPLAVVVPQIVRRFKEAPVESEHAREIFNEIAKQIGDARFFGAGLNNYSYYGGFVEQYREQLPSVDQGGLAHHIYWLHYAELGLVGVGLFVLMMLGFILAMLRFIAKRKDGLERVLATALLASFVVAMFIGTLEWNWRQTQMTLIYMMLAGVACSLARVERDRLAMEKLHAQRRKLLASMAYGQERGVGVPAVRRNGTAPRPGMPGPKLGAVGPVRGPRRGRTGRRSRPS